MNAQQRQQILQEYLRQNKDTYTSEALYRRMEESGYVPAEIEAAWKVVDAEVGGVRSDLVPKKARNLQSQTESAQASILALAYLIILCGVPLGIYGNTQNANGGRMSVIAFVIILSVGLVGSRAFSERSPVVSAGLRWGLWAFGGVTLGLTLFAFVSSIIIAGICPGGHP